MERKSAKGEVELEIEKTRVAAERSTAKVAEAGSGYRCYDWPLKRERLVADPACPMEIQSGTHITAIGPQEEHTTPKFLDENLVEIFSPCARKFWWLPQPSPPRFQQKEKLGENKIEPEKSPTS